jgi:hypothetical protein
VRAASIAALAVAVAALALPPPPAAADDPAGQPPFGAEPVPELRAVRDLERTPPGFSLSAAEAIAIADRAAEVVAEREESPRMRPVAFTRGSERWQVGYFQDGVEVAQAVVDDPTGTLIEAWRDHQVEVKLARGYEDAVAGNVSETWIWIPLCLLFFLPFFDPRRPFRLLHLDLLVLLAFGVSQLFFNRGEIVVSVPLVYPVLAYVFVRMLIAGFRPREREGPLIPLVPVRWLTWGAVALVLFRIALNVIDSQVIDIGFAGVVGADRITSGEGVYDGSFSPLIDRGDSYGPLNYLLYVPFEQLFPWGGGLEPLPAAHAVAILFDLLVVGLLVLLGRRLRDGAEGAALGIALAFAWLAYPYTLYALNANGGNDAIVAASLVGALLVLGSAPARGLVLALGAAVKFGPLALAPLFAAGSGERRWRSALVFGLVLVAVWAVVLVPLLPDGGLREFYDRTLGYQASRGSPFSIWGLEPSLGWLQDLVRGGAVALGLALFFLPVRRDALQIAALGAALLIATQAGSTHWFYFFILWWTPYVLANVFASQRRITSPRDAAAAAGSLADRRPQLAERW